MKTHTLAVGIEFIGTRYRGWQRQEEVIGVQAVIEKHYPPLPMSPLSLSLLGVPMQAYTQVI